MTTRQSQPAGNGRADGEKKAGREARRETERAAKRASRSEVYRAWSKHLPQPVDYALVQWVERFPPDLLFWECYHLSRSVEWSEVARTVLGSGLVLRLSSDSEYRIHDKTGAVFVIADGWEGVKVVKTVVRLNLFRRAKQ